MQDLSFIKSDNPYENLDIGGKNNPLNKLLFLIKEDIQYQNVKSRYIQELNKENYLMIDILGSLKSDQANRYNINDTNINSIHVNIYLQIGFSKIKINLFEEKIKLSDFLNITKKCFEKSKNHIDKYIN